MPFSVYAPGNLVLIGEYADLHGWPALVAAIDRRIEVEIAPRNDKSSLTMPHLGLAALPIQRFHASLTEAEKRLVPAEVQTVRSVLDLIDVFQQMVNFGRTAPPPMNLTVDARPMLSAQGSEFGLESGAALTVALIAGLYAHARGLRPDRSILLRHALAVHRRLQRGAGSGIDVAASVYGGYQIFQRSNKGADGPPRIRPVTWPDGLFLRAFRKDQPASTAQILFDLEKFRHDETAYFRNQMTRLGEAAWHGVQAIENRLARGFMDAADFYYRLLAHLATRSGVPLVTPEDERLAALARTGGGAYKPSGAGGGHIGLVIADTSLNMDRIVEALSEAGYQMLDLAWGVEGVAL